MIPGGVPQAVLAERLAECIGGRKVRAAVFTTFSFDSGFFELHILPTLFDMLFSQAEKVKRLQLEEALQAVGEVAVYYDRTALSQDALPAQLDVHRIGVRTPHGIFHPKLILVLVDRTREEASEPGKSRPESLIVGVLSANLTRAGWWENVEVGHFETVEEQDGETGATRFARTFQSSYNMWTTSGMRVANSTPCGAFEHFCRRVCRTPRHRSMASKASMILGCFLASPTSPHGLRREAWDISLGIWKWCRRISMPKMREPWRDWSRYSGLKRHVSIYLVTSMARPR